MKQKGFVTSALLYGILSLFLVLILGTISIIGNRKIANDKIKQSALDDVQNLTTDESCFNFDAVTGIITGYHIENTECTKTVFIPEEIGGTKVTKIGPEAFANKNNENLINVTIKNDIKIANTAFKGNDNILFIFKGSSPQRTDDGTLWGATNSSIRID